ncbi:hypothetical protein PsYK624_122450 [Phanerochaete sordida]|uniref:Uncharacterized protein n=1 Tax=Phanerochaete sordida TaxID=48140 RepID=A0A9P3GI70_9APHY|nr:hypothetical protein PsYK624_122450 [Phanerochaete sordida]
MSQNVRGIARPCRRVVVDSAQLACSRELSRETPSVPAPATLAPVLCRQPPSLASPHLHKAARSGARDAWLFQLPSN